MKTIQMNTTAILNSFSNQEMDAETMKIVSCLFEATNDYEVAERNIERLISVIRRSLDEIEEGQTPFYSIGDKGIELAQETAKRDAAKKLFETVAKLSGFTVE